MPDFETKDSGTRREFDSGFVRDTRAGKPAFNLLVLAGIPFEDQPIVRYVNLLTRGADKYEARNYEKGLWPDGEVPVESPECEHYKASMLTHAFQHAAGETDEDHASAAAWNAMMLQQQREADARNAEAAPQTVARGLSPEREKPVTFPGYCGDIARDSEGRPGLLAYSSCLAALDAPCVLAPGHGGRHGDRHGIRWDSGKWCQARMEVPDSDRHLVCISRADHADAGEPEHRWDWERPVAQPGE